MSNVDEGKVKDMLHLIVESMYTMMERNMYRDSVVSELHARIRNANLLTDQAPCATVKKSWMEVQDSDVVLSVERVDGEYPIRVKRTPRLSPGLNEPKSR